MKQEWRSFGHALRGWGLFVREKGHPRFHHLAALAAIAISIWLGISGTEWLWIITAIVLVYTSEMINSALELLIDRIHPEKDEVIRNVKDRLASAVLVFSLFALIIGVMIWQKYL